MAVTSLHWWRTVFWLIPTIGVYTSVLGTISVIAGILGADRLAHGCARTWAWLILATTGVNVSVRGLERVPRGQPFLFLSNHQSIYDIPVIFWYIPFDLRIIAKESLGSFPFIGWHLRRTGHVLVRRDNPGPQVFKQLGELMRQRRSLIVFPEGTRSADGRVQRFRTGIFRLAIESGYTIVPVAVHGTRQVMRKGRLATGPGWVSLEMFDPVETTQLTLDGARALADRIQSIVEGGVAAAESEARRREHAAAGGAPPTRDALGAPDATTGRSAGA
jgi:1-acyl-sn-glycerol-3-phosphate acyltransferase